MTKKNFPVQEIQRYIAEQKILDGWLIYDFRGHNTLGLEMLGIDEEQLLSRRFFYWIPKQGSPLKIVHQIESHTLKSLPGDQIVYESWQSLDLALKSTLRKRTRIAMEHSPKCDIPVLAKLDAGFYEWLLDKNISVVSSWPIAKHFICRWDQKQLISHRKSAKFLENIFEMCWETATTTRSLSEFHLQEKIMDAFAEKGFVSAHPPIVAVGPNSALPHYSPVKSQAAKIKKDSLLLVDIWCKQDSPSAPYADFTQVAYLGKKAPSEMVKVYNAVKEAQTAGIDYVQKNLQKGNEVLGCDVDDVCRASIRKAGYGKYFVHRTGHNINTMLHGQGPNLDNLETHDDRPLMSRTCYSVEPGIYLPKAFGIRLESNIFIHDDLKVEVTGRSPDTLPCLY